MSAEARPTRYPPFAMPIELSTPPVETWTATQAADYLAWLTSVMDERITTMFKYWGIAAAKPWSARDLDALDGRLTVELVQPPYWEPSYRFPALSGEGYSVAADAGLLLAHLLLREPGVSWEIVRKPRSDISYNRPVLVGFTNGRTIDPIRASIGAAQKIVAGLRTGAALREVYDFALSQLPGMSRDIRQP